MSTRKHRSTSFRNLQGIYRKINFILIFVIIIISSGCASTHTALNKKELVVQIKMSDTIFLEPVSPEERTIYVEVKNTSDRPELNLNNIIKNDIAKKGYIVVNDPQKAHYLLQANVLQVGQTDLRIDQNSLNQGFGGAVTGGAAGAVIGNILSDNDDAVFAGGLLGAGLGLLSDAMIKDIVYFVITDLQISERVNKKVRVRERTLVNLRQGSNGSRNISSREIHNWKKHQTRIISTANKVNLKLEEALPQLIAGLSNSISGVM